MSWLQRLLLQAGKPAKSSSKLVNQATPTVKFDPSNVSKNVKSNLLNNIKALDDVQKKNVDQLYDAALRSILSGRDLHTLSTALIDVAGMTRARAAHVALDLNNKASAIINRERQASLGITHAIWLYPNAPCMREPFAGSPTAEDLQQDAAHKAANGKRYEIAKGLHVNGKWTWPGFEEGCRCGSRVVIPGLEP